MLTCAWSSRIDLWPKQFNVYLTRQSCRLSDIQAWLRTHGTPLCMFMPDRHGSGPASQSNDANFRQLARTMMDNQVVSTVSYFTGVSNSTHSNNPRSVWRLGMIPIVPWALVFSFYRRHPPRVCLWARYSSTSHFRTSSSTMHLTRRPLFRPDCPLRTLILRHSPLLPPASARPPSARPRGRCLPAHSAFIRRSMTMLLINTLRSRRPTGRSLLSPSHASRRATLRSIGRTSKTPQMDPATHLRALRTAALSQALTLSTNNPFLLFFRFSRLLSLILF